MDINTKYDFEFIINKGTMTPRERVMTALRGGRPDKIPFLSDIIPSAGTFERELRNRGMCLCKWRQSFLSHSRNVDVKSINFKNEKSNNAIKTIYTTPFGDLTEVKEIGAVTNWTREYLFKSPGDYRRLLYYIEDTIVEPEFEAALKEKVESDGDAVFLDFAGYSPLPEIIYKYMGTETFCYEWADNRDEILKLYKAIEERNWKMLNIAAKGPFEVVLYGLNLVPQLIGTENFVKYFKPNYQECLDLLHKNGKLVGGHFDGNNATFMSLLSETEFDYISAYDPSISPCVKEARKALPGKVLWLNFPCTWHLLPVKEIREKTIQLIEEAGQGDGFIIGITETVPPERLLANYKAILDGIDEYEENTYRKKDL